MWFPQTVEYALRALAVLARDEGAALSATELAERTSVPAPYLSKVMRRLVLAGIVTARRGHGGGFTLARRPEEVPIERVLVALDLATNDGHCAFGWSRCDEARPCPLHPLWGDLRARLAEWSQDHTLADALAGRSRPAPARPEQGPRRAARPEARPPAPKRGRRTEGA